MNYSPVYQTNSNYAYNIATLVHIYILWSISFPIAENHLVTGIVC